MASADRRTIVTLGKLSDVGMGRMGLHPLPLDARPYAQ